MHKNHEILRTNGRIFALNECYKDLDEYLSYEIYNCRVLWFICKTHILIVHNIWEMQWITFVVDSCSKKKLQINMDMEINEDDIFFSLHSCAVEGFRWIHYRLYWYLTSVSQFTQYRIDVIKVDRFTIDVFIA